MRSLFHDKKRNLANLLYNAAVSLYECLLLISLTSINVKIMITINHKIIFLSMDLQCLAHLLIMLTRSI